MVSRALVQGKAYSFLEKGKSDLPTVYVVIASPSYSMSIYKANNTCL